MNEELAKKIVDFMRNGGVDDIGILPIEQIKGAEPGFLPTDLMPEAKSVILYYIRQFQFPRLGVMQPDNKPAGLVEYTANFFICANLLDQLAYRASCLINDEGFDAFPVSAGPPYNGVKLRGLISHKYLHELAGLSERAMSDVTITEKYGPRVRLGAIITNAELPAMVKPKKKICDPDKCGEACAKACPVGAISKDGLNLNACDRYNEIVIAFGPSKIRCGRCLDACPVGKPPKANG